MDAQCTKCGMQIALTWDFCPHCGLAVDHENQPAAPYPEHEKSGLPGAFGGLYFGVVMAPVLLIFGGLLCLTGLGAFLGVPLIIAGILAPVLGPMMGIGEHRGKCPSCGMRVITVADGHNHYCPACDREFAVGEHQVAKAH